jgi:hypothetical protein
MGVVSCGTTMLDQGVFNNIGAVTWDTTAKTAGFTAVSGNGYFCNTTSAAFTVTLPATPSAGDIVGIKDYANTADTNNITIGRNGSNIQGIANDFVINTEGRSVLLVYVDATKGWLVTSASQASDISEQATFITATGGTITTCGDFKIHTFTGPGTFCVSGISNTANENIVSYVVVAGGGGAGGHPGNDGGGGGGAGGFRENKSPVDTYTASPLEGSTNITVTATAYPITVGAGGGPGNQGSMAGTQGSNSVFSTIISAGGGNGRSGSCVPVGAGPGGSGGGGGGGFGAPGSGFGNGNTPPVSPPQGNNGGNGSAIGSPPDQKSGGGGGAGAVGETAGTYSGQGGCGVSSSITGSPVARAGGGGGAGGACVSCRPGGTGGGGSGNTGGNGSAGTPNTGGGGGGAANGAGGAGGSGIVIIRYKYQ